MMKPFKTLLVVGSVRLGRQSHKIASYLEQLFREYDGIEVEILDLIDYPLPMMEERYGILPNPSELVREVGERIRAADAAILVSPEYGGSFSGVLKNAIDLFGRQLSDKPIGVVTTSGGKLGGVNASHHLQNLILSIRSFPMPQKLLVPMIQDAFDENGQPIGAELAKGSELFIGEFLEFASAITARRRGVFKPVRIGQVPSEN